MWPGLGTTRKREYHIVLPEYLGGAYRAVPKSGLNVGFCTTMWAQLSINLNTSGQVLRRTHFRHRTGRPQCGIKSLPRILPFSPHPVGESLFAAPPRLGYPRTHLKSRGVRGFFNSGRDRQSHGIPACTNALGSDTPTRFEFPILPSESA